MTTLFKFLFTGRRKGELSPFEEEQIQSPGKTVAKEFFKRKLTIVGLIGFFAIFLASMLIPVIIPIDLHQSDTGLRNVPPNFSMMRIPREVRDNMAQISSGARYAAGLTNDGEVYVWGSIYGVMQPIWNIPHFDGEVVHISAGLEHVIAVTADGRIHAWGHNNITARTTEVPQAIQGRVVTAEAGFRTTVAILDDGTMHVFGGMNDNRANINPGRIPPGSNLVQVEMSFLSAGVRTDDGYIHIPNPASRVYREVPDEVQGRAVDFAMTDRNVAAILDDGTVVAWGADEAAFHVPPEVQGRATRIEGGSAHFTALLSDGSVVSWGDNAYGQINAPQGTGFVEIVTGFHHNYAFRADGTVETWGLQGFLMGTDEMGRDIFGRLWTAGRYSLFIGAIAIIIATVLGITLGSIAGYFGGTADMLIMRFGEAVGSIPFLPIALLLNWHFGRDMDAIPALMLLMVILGFFMFPPIMRLVRGQVLQARQTEYVLGARALGVREPIIIGRHIMPNILSVIIVQFALGLAASMLIESTLGFLGFGIEEPTPTWGNMLNAATNTIVLREQWWRWVFPAIALVTVTLSINLIGDGLREAFDPRTRGR
ncbi:MAG: ABC transporter permease subunit [Clostridiales bacterium]|nr:ABC transporter permease subunit [Clostridiales bacterium]